jgi:hypothetical protein
VRVVPITHEEKRPRLLCHRGWLVGEKNLALKKISKQRSLLSKGYEDIFVKEVQLGIRQACLVSLDLVRKSEREGSYGEQ